MRRAIELDEARRMLLSRSGLLDRGVAEREIRLRVERGELVRVRRGWYAAATDWQVLWPEGRHLLRVLAVQHDATGSAPVFCGTSAGVLWGLPLYRTAPRRVHVAETRGRSRSTRDVLRHETELADDDVAEIDGMRCTSLHRTVFDLARKLSAEAAVAGADAALRAVAVTGQRQDEALAEEWREELGRRAHGSRARGVRQARRIIAFADGRAQLPGESVSRLQLHRLGFRRIGLQVPVVLSRGQSYWIDFDLEEAGAFGEFDGEGKYLHAALRSGRTVEQVVLDEKRREDTVRGVTGRRFVRWEAAHIRTPEALAERLAEFGVRPPRG
ncbi:hypothetical protein [Microbacterium sp.]|uniref:hypothetical protein n=1 Tax=Microbacterium sp. TaxID=51671 RepID=UPI00333EAFD9